MGVSVLPALSGYLQEQASALADLIIDQVQFLAATEKMQGKGKILTSCRLHFRTSSF